MIQMGVDIYGESFIFCFQDSIPEDGGGGERVEEFKFTN
jgi:hypothetical protein